MRCRGFDGRFRSLASFGTSRGDLLYITGVAVNCLLVVLAEVLEERVKGAKERLGPLGEPEKVEADPASERGGMEVVVVHFTFKDKKVKTLMYRSPDGKVQATARSG